MGRLVGVRTSVETAKDRPAVFRRRIDWFIQNRSFKIDAARRDFGYNPSIPLDQCLRKTGEWYLKHGLVKLS